MATYRQIHTHIWDDPDFEALSPHAKLVFIYGFSNKHRNEAGLYTLTIRKLAFETSLSIEEAEAAVKEIEAKGMWRYDWDNQVLWVKNALKYQTVTEKNLMAIKKDIAAIDSPLVAEFKEYYKDLLSPSEGAWEEDRWETKPPAKNGNDKGKNKDKGKYNTISDEIVSAESADAPSPKSTTEKTPYKAIVDLYNQICVSMPKVIELTDKRRKAIYVQWRRHPDIEHFRRLFERAEASDFLTGRSGKWAGCNFDWLMKESNMVKVLEGTYDNKASPGVVIDYEAAKSSKYGW